MSDQFKRPWRWRIVHGPWCPSRRKGIATGSSRRFRYPLVPGSARLRARDSWLVTSEM
jgi:hypothetical protein